MSQLNVNALSQPDAAPLNGTPVSGQQIGAPAGLGNNHSVGRTIGRVIAAIFTLGISEAVRFIIRAVRAESAPAVPHLPQNRELSSQALRALELGKSRALATLGAFCEVDAAALQKRLEKAVDDELEPMDAAALEELAEKTARAVLIKSIVMTAVKEDPVGSTFTPEQQTLLALSIFVSQQALALAEAPNAEAAAKLVVTIKDVTHETICSQEDMAAVKKELFSTGLEFFRKTTGLNEEQTASFNTRNLENKMNMTRGDIDKQFATLDRPYARARRDALLEGFRPEAECFFADRAAAYNSIANLDLPDSLKTALRNICLVAREHISADTFSKADAFGRALANFSQWDSLMDPKLTVDEKLGLLGGIATNIVTLWAKSFGEKQLADMGTDERGLITDLMYEVVWTVKPELLASLQTSPAVEELKTELQARVVQADHTADANELSQRLAEIRDPLNKIPPLQKPQE